MIYKRLHASPSVEDKFALLNKSIKHIKVPGGLYLEFGVWQGATINHIAKKIGANTIYGFDSFKGLPEAWNHCPVGTFAVAELPIVEPNVVLVNGLFEDTLDSFLQEHTQKCSFIHIDCDLYTSTKTVFEKLKRRIVKGTVIQFDELYNYEESHDHEMKAFRELLRETKMKFDFIAHVSDGQQAAVRIKQGAIIRPQLL